MNGGGMFDKNYHKEEIAYNKNSALPQKATFGNKSKFSNKINFKDF